MNSKKKTHEKSGLTPQEYSEKYTILSNLRKTFWKILSDPRKKSLAKLKMKVQEEYQMKI